MGAGVCARGLSMIKMSWAMSALVGSATLLGCDFPQREALVENPWSKPGQPGVVTMPGELRAAYIAGGKDAVLRYCAEPAPDTAAQAALKVATAIEASGKLIFTRFRGQSDYAAIASMRVFNSNSTGLR